jgi:putative ABC transport system permease protein
MRLWDRILLSLEGALIAVDSLRQNKVRAALTISGVAVGVFVVVAMGATVHGIRQSFQKDMDEFGTATFQVRRRNPGFNACNPTSDDCTAATPASRSRSGRRSSGSPRWTT